VARLIGVVCLAYTVQRHLGQRVSPAPVGQQRGAQWTVSDRVSWFWCGQRLCGDPGYDWSGWVAQQWESLGLPVAVTPASTVCELALAEAAWLKGDYSPARPLAALQRLCPLGPVVDPPG